jgi:hypothetical protein
MFIVSPGASPSMMACLLYAWHRPTVDVVGLAWDMLCLWQAPDSQWLASHLPLTAALAPGTQ